MTIMNQPSGNAPNPHRVIRLGLRVDAPGDASIYKLPRDHEEDRLVTIPVDSLTRHMCIFGRTGSGKSVTGMVIAQELSAIGGISILVLDRTGEFAHSPLSTLPGTTVYTPGANLTLSPFARRSDNSDDDVERAISLMHHFVGSSFRGMIFTPYQERALGEALKSCYGADTSRLSDVLSELRAQGEESRTKVKGWLEGNEAVVSRLRPLASGSLAQVFDTDAPPLDESELFAPGLRIVNLGPLETDEARNMVSQVLIKLLISHGKKLGWTKELRFVLMVDEAHHIAPARRDYEGILERYATELRKYGMGLVVMATRPTQVSEDIIANSNTVICHSMTSGKDVDLALNYMVSRLEADKFVSDLRKLEVGECLIQLNDASTDIPLGCNVGLQEHSFLLAPTQNTLNRVSLTAESPKTPQMLLDDVPQDDSAWRVYDNLPAWAKEAAKLIHDSGGRVPRKRLSEKGYSNKQLKQMVHGTFPIAEMSGSLLVLTKLGEKLAAVSMAIDDSSRHPCDKHPDPVRRPGGGQHA
jgi:hypothetical protein